MIYVDIEYAFLFKINSCSSPFFNMIYTQELRVESERDTVVTTFRRMLKSLRVNVSKGQLRISKDGKIVPKLRKNRVNVQAVLYFRTLRKDLRPDKSLVTVAGFGTLAGGGAEMVTKRSVQKVRREYLCVAMFMRGLKCAVIVIFSGGQQHV